MSTHASENTPPADDVTAFKGGSKLIGIGGVLAALGLIVALAAGYSGTAVFRPFLFGYLAAYVFVMAICIGALGFVLLQHLTRAAWSVSVRRIAENLAGAIPVLAIFGIPFIVTVLLGHGTLFRWALPMSRASEAAVKAAEEGETELPVVPPAPRLVGAKEKESKENNSTVGEGAEAEMQISAEEVAAPSHPEKFELEPLVLAKRNYGLHWLHPGFFTLRMIFYFVVWSGIAIWFRKTSILQDKTGDENLTLKMQALAAPCVVIMVLTVTGLAFDLLMSLDPHWYSTMFGVYYIAETFLASYAAMIICVFLFHKFGYLRKSLTIEHYHDLGKYLFAFTFFYGYIAFSQYMLMWYANIPEETEYMARHGASTWVHNGWNALIVAILFCHILIPFAGLMSRHIKRRPAVLVFWAVWQLVMVAVDMYWLVMPELGPIAPTGQSILVTVFAVLGLGGILIAVFGLLSGQASLRATHDPRLAASLVFENI